MLHQVGSGVLGPVFRTYDPESNRLIAIKAIKLDIVPEDMARLAEALKQLATVTVGHPAIVAVIDAGIQDGRAFVASEYLAGESLDVALRHLAPSPLEPALRLLEQVAGAIDAAWAAGVGHGALHPRDVFIAPGGLDVRITGFGMVNALERAGLKAPARRPYTAPERNDGREWDIRADVYSVGAIAHDLLAGRRPGAGGDQDGLLGGLPADDRRRVRQALAAALAPQPQHRFASAAAFVQALGGVATRAAAPILPAPVVAEPAPSVVEEPHPEPEPAVAAPDEKAPPAPTIGLGLTPTAYDHFRSRPAGAVRVSTRTAADQARADEEASRSKYPWAAIAAVAVAALTLGGVGGYAIARRTAQVGEPPAAPQQAAAPADTEVAVVPEPPARVTEPPRPAARVATAEPGRLVVRSVPAGALVTVDGRIAGETPTTVTDLSLGSHTVVIARPGYVPRTERVSLSARSVSRTLTVELRPGMDVRSAQLGSIYVDSRPRGARVLIDGRPIGTTPLGLPEIGGGEHRVQIELEGYSPHVTTVTVRPGEQTRLAVSLTRGGSE